MVQPPNLSVSLQLFYRAACDIVVALAIASHFFARLTSEQ